MSQEEKPKVQLVTGQEDKINRMFLVTVKTTFKVIDGNIVSDKMDLTDKEVLQIEERDVRTSELEQLGIEAKNYNQRQEFYKKEENKMSGEINFMYLASKDPRKNTETPTQE